MKLQKCKSCQEVLRGRKDKKFCNDACRNAYNNSIRKDSTLIMRKINNSLKRNRTILEQLVPTNREKIKVEKQLLNQLGFDFSMLTSIHTTSSGIEYKFVYDYGYLELDDYSLALIRRE